MNTEPGVQSIWEYQVKQKFRAEFIQAYASNGLWVSLFEQCKGYIKTELKHDAEHPDRFLTIDYWQSLSAFSAMKLRLAGQYHRLDKQCAAYTLADKHIGLFRNV